MPPILCTRCSKCEFILWPRWYMYVTDNAGKRIACPHPNEFRVIYSVLGKNISDEVRKQRTGIKRGYLCMDCLSIIELDRDRDKIVCSKCNSSRLAAEDDLIGNACPICKEGTIRIIDTGGWT